MKFYDSNLELLLSTFSAGLFSFSVCLYILNYCISKKDKNKLKTGMNLSHSCQIISKLDKEING